MQVYNSLIQDYRFHRIGRSQLFTSLQRLFEKEDQEDEEDVKDTDSDESEIRQEDLRAPKIDQEADLEIGVHVNDNQEADGDVKIGADLEFRVKVDENEKEDVPDKRESGKYVTSVFDKKRGVLYSDTIKRSLMKTTMSRRSEQVTPSYRLIPEEEQSPVSNTKLEGEETMAAMLRENLLELWRSITAKLTPHEVDTIRSLLVEFGHNRIGSDQVITSSLLLLQKHDDLHRRFTDMFCANNPQDNQEDEDAETRNDEDDDDIEEGEIRERDQPIKANLFQIRVGIDENPQRDSLDKKGKKKKKKKNRGILIEKKTRKSKRLEKLTPSYTHILEEEEYSDDTETVLNNKYASVGQGKGQGWKRKTTDYEVAMAKCEDDMFEVDRLIGTLSHALKTAEQVMSGKMRLEEIGTMFYICIKKLYNQDMSEIVRQDYQNALHVIIPRLRQKLNEAMLARETWIPHWKQVLEENTAKQRDSTAKVAATDVEALKSPLMGLLEKLRARKFIIYVQDYDETDPKSHVGLDLNKKYEHLHRRFTDICCANNLQEEQEDEDEEEDEETRNGEIRQDETNHHLLEVVVVEDEDDDDIKEGEIRERDVEHEDEATHHLDQQIKEEETNLYEIRVDIDENPKRGSFAKINLKGKKKKRGILESKDQIKTSTRRSKRLQQVTPSYTHILLEEGDDTETELNNKYVSVGQGKGQGWIRKKTDYEEEMAKCEDDMFELDRWIGTMDNAMKSAEDVMSGEIGLEKIGTMFYICIKQMYCQDMSDIVKQDYQKALPVIIPRLKQKFDEATLVKETWIPHWKQVFEENTAKQRDFTAQGRKQGDSTAKGRKKK
ncbi:hypothetical protein AALP_AA3G276200 [Arabis alpina]|uniref:Histone deacetylase interacting domain-containing protein n=1 Tax=Arabis alpina TaxID=50452 RepID=A0A087HC35_ARAAL|nr:hypothetical protein AALP_AA3G276200 [Arabis alpina]